jgi:hypothetical protein
MKVVYSPSARAVIGGIAPTYGFPSTLASTQIQLLIEPILPKYSIVQLRVRSLNDTGWWTSTQSIIVFVEFRQESHRDSCLTMPLHRHHLNSSKEALRNTIDETPLIKHSTIQRNNHSNLNRESRSKDIQRIDFQLTSDKKKQYLIVFPFL